MSQYNDNDPEFDGENEGGSRGCFFALLTGAVFWLAISAYAFWRMLT